LVKHQTRNILFIVFAIAIIGSMIFFLFPIQEGGALNIRIPSLSVIQTPEGAIPVGEINCKVRQITQVFSSSGTLLDTIESDTLIGTPFVQLQFPIVTANTLDEISYFTVQPRIFCTQSSGQTVHAQGSPLSLNLFAQGHLIDDVAFSPPRVVERFTNFGGFGLGSTNILTFPSVFGEQSLGQYIVKISDILTTCEFLSGGECLPDEDFEFNLQFAIFGNIDIFYPDTPTCPDCSQFKFKFPVQKTDIDTFYATMILLAPPDTTDTDNDGIIDEFDLCPNSAETFNGFQDSDGCPDTATSDTPTTTSEPDPEKIVVLGTQVIETPMTCEATGDPVLCQQECEERGGTWTIQEGAGLAPICITNVIIPPELVEEIISEPTLVDAIIEPIQDIIQAITGEEPTEEIRLSEGGIVVTQDPTTGELTTRLATELPSPLFEPTPEFELEQEVPEPQQFETTEIRPPMVDDTFLIVIVFLLIGGFIAVVIISRFTKL